MKLFQESPDTWMDGWTDRQIDGRTGCTDSPCMLQDFVSSSSLRSRCPKREKPVAQRQEVVIGTLALLWYFWMVAIV